MTKSLFYVSKNPKNHDFHIVEKNVCTSCSINIINENHLFIFGISRVFLKTILSQPDMKFDIAFL